MFELNLTITLAAVFTAVALIAGTVILAVLERTPTRRRLEALVAPAARVRTSLVADSHAANRLEQLAAYVPASSKDLGSLRRRLAMSGSRGRAAVSRYQLLQATLVTTGVVLPLIVQGVADGAATALVGGGLGYMAPGLLLDRRIARRKRLIENGLPDALDLLIVSIESGLALDHAIVKTGEELALAHPEVAEELRLVNVECRAGKSRLEALKNFATRTKVDDVRALVAMLVQTDRFGTSIAQALRTHAQVSRTKRRQRAEERAAKVGVKLVFPLVFCLFPAFYVVTLGPAIIKFLHAFGSGGFISGVTPP